MSLKVTKFDFEPVCHWVIVLALFFTGLGLLIFGKESWFELLICSFLAYMILID